MIEVHVFLPSTSGAGVERKNLTIRNIRDYFEDEDRTYGTYEVKLDGKDLPTIDHFDRQQGWAALVTIAMSSIDKDRRCKNCGCIKVDGKPHVMGGFGYCYMEEGKDSDD